MAGAESGVENDGYANKAKSKACIGEIAVVALDLGKEIVDRYMEAEPISENGEYGVPHTCAQGGVEAEAPYIHSGEAGRDRYELPDGRYESSDKSRHGAMAVEIGFGAIHFGTVDEAGVAQPRVGEAINQRASDPY